MILDEADVAAMVDAVRQFTDSQLAPHAQVRDEKTSLRQTCLPARPRSGSAGCTSPRARWYLADPRHSRQRNVTSRSRRSSPGSARGTRCHSLRRPSALWKATDHGKVLLTH